MEAAINSTLEWLDNNQLAKVEEFEHQLKELEGVCTPVITKLYQQQGGAEAGGMPGGMPPGAGGMPTGGAEGGASAGPNIEEVD